MEDVRALVPRTPPEGLTSWRLMWEALEISGLVYEAVWIEERGLEYYLDEYAKPRKVKMVEVCCSCCGERGLLPWCKTDEIRGGYGFLHPAEEMPAGSGDITQCPFCEAPVLVKKAAEIGPPSRWQSYFISDETHVMSAAVVGEKKYMVLTGWTIQRRVYRSAHEEVKFIPAEAYVFGPANCWKLMGWKNSYSGQCGHFITYSSDWRQPRDWSESWGAADCIYGLTPELVAGSCLPNCKLDVYMESFQTMKRKFPVAWLRLYQFHHNAENLLLSGLPLVLDDLLAEACGAGNWETNRRGLPAIEEVDWNEARPDRMLGLAKDELRMAREQGWGAFGWRLFLRAKQCGERLTAEDIENAFILGDDAVVDLPGQGPVGKSLRYLLKQIERIGEYMEALAEEEFEDLAQESAIDVSFLLDYWRACRDLGRDLSDAQVRWPRDLIDAHNTVMEQKRRAEREVKEKALAPRFRIRRRQLARYIFEADGLKIVPAQSERDLRKEADTLHHCVWTYAQRHAEGKTAIFFIRRTVEPGTPYYTLELDEEALRVRQNRGLRNCGKTEAVQAFEDLWISWVRAGAKRDRDGKPVLPERTRRRRSA